MVDGWLMNPIATATRSSGPVRPATGNDCLDALSADALGLLRPHLSEVAVDEGHVFWDAEIYLTTLFPASGLVSITVRLASGEGIEVASVAKEGAAAQFTLEPLHTVTQASAFAGGTFFRIPSARFWQLHRGTKRSLGSRISAATGFSHRRSNSRRAMRSIRPSSGCAAGWRKAAGGLAR